MSDAKNDQNAWEYIKWWAGDEAQERFSSAGKMLYFTGQLPRLFLETFIVVLAMAIIIGFVYSGMPSGTILLSITLLAAALFRTVVPERDIRRS